MKTPLIALLLAAAVASSPAYAMDPRRAAMHMEQNEEYFGKPKDHEQAEAAETVPVEVQDEMDMETEMEMNMDDQAGDAGDDMPDDGDEHRH